MYYMRSWVPMGRGAWGGHVPAHFTVPMHERRGLSALFTCCSGRMCLAPQAADKCIRHCEGWKDGDADFCTLTLDPPYLWNYWTVFNLALTVSLQMINKLERGIFKLLIGLHPILRMVKNWVRLLKYSTDWSCQMMVNA